MVISSSLLKLEGEGLLPLVSSQLHATLPSLTSSPFAAVLKQHGFGALNRTESPSTLQINVGKICNQACHHCHVEAGPKRTESMTRETARRLITLLSASASIATVDITGGAPEINPNFEFLVEESRRLGRGVIDRCNLTILLEPGYNHLPRFLAQFEVEIVASLPCYTAENVDRQRGRGVFDRSIRALQLLNSLGYGTDARLPLNLVFNPGGAALPPPQQALEDEYRRRLRADWRIEFTRLYALTNMPIRRFASHLHQIGKTEQYHDLLMSHFNPDTVGDLMCRKLVSVSWDGRLYDCDFNQMLEMPLVPRTSIWDLESFDVLTDTPIVTGDHCFGCTAGAGSSCGGTLK